MAMFGKGVRRVRDASLRVAFLDRPGWQMGTERLPSVGEWVECAEGSAEVVRLLGRTGDGSRLLELSLPERPRQPFFAAASNVLVRSGATAE